MARATKTLADRGGTAFDVAYEATDDGHSPVSTVREIEAAPSLESRLDAIEAALGGTLTTQLSGRNPVVIGGVTFYTDGGTVFGPAADRPAAADVHAVIPYGFYLAVDTGVLSRNTGAAWVS